MMKRKMMAAVLTMAMAATMIVIVLIGEALGMNTGDE